MILLILTLSYFRDACRNFISLWKRKHESGQWLEIETAEVTPNHADFSAINASGIIFSNMVTTSHTKLDLESNGKTNSGTWKLQHMWTCIFAHCLWLSSAYLYINLGLEVIQRIIIFLSGLRGENSWRKIHWGYMKEQRVVWKPYTTLIVGCRRLGGSCLGSVNNACKYGFKGLPIW